MLSYETTSAQHQSGSGVFPGDADRVTSLTVGWIYHNAAALMSHALLVTDYMSTRPPQPALIKHFLPFKGEKKQQILVGCHNVNRMYSTCRFPQIRCQRRFKVAEPA